MGFFQRSKATRTGIPNQEIETVRHPGALIPALTPWEGFASLHAVSSTSDGPDPPSEYKSSK